MLEGKSIWIFFMKTVKIFEFIKWKTLSKVWMEPEEPDNRKNEPKTTKLWTNKTHPQNGKTLEKVFHHQYSSPKFPNSTIWKIPNWDKISLSGVALSNIHVPKNLHKFYKNSFLFSTSRNFFSFSFFVVKLEKV